MANQIWRFLFLTDIKIITENYAKAIECRNAFCGLGPFQMSLVCNYAVRYECAHLQLLQRAMDMLLVGPKLACTTACVCELWVPRDHGSSGSAERGGKILVKHNSASTAVQVCIRTENARERESERGRVGGHSVDKVDLFLIYVLL